MPTFHPVSTIDALVLGHLFEIEGLEYLAGVFIQKHSYLGLGIDGYQTFKPGFVKTS